jgi:hypothetical protein
MQANVSRDRGRSDVGDGLAGQYREVPGGSQAYRHLRSTHGRAQNKDGDKDEGDDRDSPCQDSAAWSRWQKHE